MSDCAPLPEDALDKWLADQHQALVSDLATVLDPEAGLREAMIPARHADLVAGLHDVLDVETGLSAIVPTTPDDDPFDSRSSAAPAHIGLNTGIPAFLDTTALRVHPIKQRERRRRAITVLASLLILALLAMGIAVWQRQSAISAQVADTRAAQASDVHAAHQLIALAAMARDTDPRTALQLGIAAQRIHPDQETQSSVVSLLTTLRYAGTLTGHTGPVLGVAFGPDGRTLATASTDHTIRLWDLATHQPITTLTGHTGAVTAVAFNPDGRTLATASLDHTIRLWDLADPYHPSPKAILTDHASTVDSVAFSSDGRSLATASNDRTVRLWDVATHQLLATLVGPTDAVTAVAFSPDGRTLSTGNFDHTVQLWNLTDTANPTPLGQPLTGHTAAVTAVAFSPDGHILATASNDQTARLWDVTDLRHPLLEATLTGHTSTVNSVAFSPNGRTLATASSDQTTRLWDLTDLHHPSPEATLTADSGVVRSVGFAPDSRTLATASDNGTTVLWDLSSISDARERQALEEAKKQAEDAKRLQADAQKEADEARKQQAEVAIQRACSITGGGLNRYQWASYIPELPYEQTCPGH